MATEVAPDCWVEFVVRNGITSDVYCTVRQLQSSTVAELKESIARQTGIRPTQQKLIVGSAAVDDLSEKALEREMKQVLPQVLRGNVEISLVKRTVEEAEWLEEWLRGSKDRPQGWRFEMDTVPEELRNSGDIMMAVLQEDFEAEDAFLDYSPLAPEDATCSCSYLDALSMYLVRKWCVVQTLRMQLHRLAGVEALAVLAETEAKLRRAYRIAQLRAAVATAFRVLQQVRPDLAVNARKRSPEEGEPGKTVPELQELWRAMDALDAFDKKPKALVADASTSTRDK